MNLAYRWFCRLSLEDEVPNHSTFSKNRHGRFRDSSLFRWLFNEVLRRCMDAGLVKGEGFAVDASVIKADASRQRGVPGDEEVNWRDPSLSTRAVREYLEALDEEALAETLPKRLSLTDPLARWTAAPGGPAFFAYSTNYLSDVGHGVIMDVEPTPAHRTAEVESTKTMIERVEEHFDIKPDRLIGDTAFGTAPMLAWMVEEKDIEPHVPVWDKTKRKNDNLSICNLQWNEEARDVARRIAATPQYVCSRHERKKVEMLFAHLKRILRLDRLRLRGMSGANDEFTLAAAVQNLRRLAKLTSQGPPTMG